MHFSFWIRRGLTWHQRRRRRSEVCGTLGGDAQVGLRQVMNSGMLESQPLQFWDRHKRPRVKGAPADLRLLRRCPRHASPRVRCPAVEIFSSLLLPGQYLAGWVAMGRQAERLRCGVAVVRAPPRWVVRGRVGHGGRSHRVPVRHLRDAGRAAHVQRVGGARRQQGAPPRRVHPPHRPRHHAAGARCTPPHSLYGRRRAYGPSGGPTLDSYPLRSGSRRSRVQVWLGCSA